MDKIEAGKEILSYCTSCKIDLGHMIVAMKGDKIAKVECKTCKKTHAFKAPKGITVPPKKKVRKKAAAEKRSVEAEWEKLMDEYKANPMKNYSTKDMFTLGDKLSHATFGYGIVSKNIYPNKIEVIFKSDIRVLIHSGHPTSNLPNVNP